MGIPETVTVLRRDLDEIFGARMRSFVAYGLNADPAPDEQPTLAVVDSLTVADLEACASRVERWQAMGLATPLVLQSGEFEQSLDAFPFEFGAILSDHVVLAGADPFAGLRIDPADLRRACELRARSHLLHLRENFIESAASDEGLAALVLRSAPALTALIENVRRVVPGFTPAAPLADVVRLNDRSHFTSDDAKRMFPGYLAAVEQLTRDVDRWSAR
jgi:hypothetical protein